MDRSLFSSSYTRPKTGKRIRIVGGSATLQKQSSLSGDVPIAINGALRRTKITKRLFYSEPIRNASQSEIANRVRPKETRAKYS